MKSYATDYMKKELSEHVLTMDGNIHSIGKPDTNIYSAYIAEVANSLCITGDICLGANQHGIVSSPGYQFGWFASHLSECYLCEKFLFQEWQWDAAVEGMQWQIQVETKDGEGWWLEHADQLEEFIKSPDWKYETPRVEEFYEFMSEIDHCQVARSPHDCVEMLGYDYPRSQAGWLCAIQQRYSELRGEMKDA